MITKPPAAMMNHPSCSEDATYLRQAQQELEALRREEQSQIARRIIPSRHQRVGFPAGCRRLLHQLPGNGTCIDCGSPRPEWASVSYGILLCLSCAGRHRSYGVQVSFVRSLAMDAWEHSQVVAMLEGGNQQITQFFDRHAMGHGHPPSSSASLSTNSNPMVDRRYLTKAALFYRTQLSHHVEQLSVAGPYPGRAASRSSPASGAASGPDARRISSNGSQRVQSPRRPRSHHHHHHHEHSVEVTSISA